MKMSPNCDIFCKKIVLKSKGIIENKTKRDFILTEENAKKFCYAIEAGTRKNSIFGFPEIKRKKENGFMIEAEGL